MCTLRDSASSRREGVWSERLLQGRSMGAGRPPSRTSGLPGLSRRPSFFNLLRQHHHTARARAPHPHAPDPIPAAVRARLPL